MEAPKAFVDSLERQFNGRLRVRWSEARSEWQIEQKTRRARVPKRRIEAGRPDEDRLRRAADGYQFVLAVKPGNRDRCPKCRTMQGIPELRMVQTKCVRCQAPFQSVYYPLGDMLLEHLRYTDPYRGGTERVFADQDKADAAVRAAQARQHHNEFENVIKDSFNEIANIPTFGYTGGVERN